jgi:hypothetical protein
MKKVIALVALTLVAQLAGAQVCSESEIQEKVYDSALYLEALNGGGHPLTEELFSLSSEQDAYIVILSYSGLQSSWKVRVDHDRCHVSSVVKQ